MGRLIDADALKKNYTNAFVEKYGVKGAEMFRDIINQMPTAYEPEKVVEQLDKIKKEGVDCNGCPYICPDGGCEHRAIDQTIEIVRKGGAT